jgi:hypothetical protein
VDDFAIQLTILFFFGLLISHSIFRMLNEPRKGAREGGFSLPETILVGSFLFYPSALVVLTILVHSGYTPRYGWPVILGLALGSAYLVQTTWSKRASIYLLAALLMAFAVQGFDDFRTLNKAPSTIENPLWAKLAELTRNEPNIPVVIGLALSYLVAAEYAPPELRNHLVLVVDDDMATRLVGADTGEKTTRALAQFVPLHVVDLASFEAMHQRFILYSSGAKDWFTQYVVEKKYDLRLIFVDDSGSIYSNPGLLYIGER